jgi:PTS system nitrogen regulatory IIA component
MDLKMKDVAELLNVSEATLQRWVLEEKIPHYKVDGQYRFGKGEIEDWVMKEALEEETSSPFSENGIAASKKSTGGSQKFSLYRAVHKGDVLKDAPGSHKEEIIRLTTKHLSKSHHFDSEILAELLLDRENLQSTALNNGIAVPHTRDFILSPTHDTVAFVFPKEPLAFGALDGNPVHTLIFLFACNDKRHLHLLAKIAHLSHQKKAQELFQKRPTKEALLEFIHNWESNIHHPNED